MKMAAAAAVLSLFGSVWAQEPGPLIQDHEAIEWKVSGSLPPGTEYHLIYEDKTTHAVQMLVRYAKGYVLPPHSHTHDETVLVVKGKLRVEMGGKTQTLGVGSYAVIPSGTEHSFKAQGWGGCEILVSLNGPFDVKGLAPIK